MTPRFRHDCEECVFLGIHETFDLYFCEKGVPGGSWATVIARFGDEGHEYKSGMAFAQQDPALRAALLLAQSRNLVTK